MTDVCLSNYDNHPDRDPGTTTQWDRAPLRLVRDTEERLERKCCFMKEFHSKVIWHYKDWAARNQHLERAPDREQVDEATDY